jgi:exodeoxyribonuclease VII small subunit
MAGAASDEGFDQVLERLKSLVDKLEHGSLTLEESLRTFEEGVALARRGHTILDAAEKRVELLVRGPGPGPGEEGETVVPFRPAGDPP